MVNRSAGAGTARFATLREHRLAGLSLSASLPKALRATGLRSG